MNSAIRFITALSLCFGLWSAGSITAHPRVRQTAGSQQLQADSLSQGGSLLKEIQGTDEQVINLNLTKGHFACVSFEWLGMDLDVMVVQPGGVAVFSGVVPIRSSGPLPISIIATETGNYVLRIQPVERLNYSGKYRVTFEESHLPTPTDERRATATKLTIEASQQNKKNLSIEKYLAALTTWNLTNDERAKAYTLHRLGSVYMSMKDVANAQPYFEQALTIRRNMSNARTLAYTLRDIGNDYRLFDSPSKAINYFQEALGVARKAGDRRAESDALYSLGFTEARRGHGEVALGYYNQALPIQIADGDQLNEVRTLNATAGAYDILSRKTEAMAFYERAKLSFEKLGDRYRQAITLNNIGLIHDDWGDYQTATTHYQAALAEIEKEVPRCDATVSGRALSICNTKASILDNLGELENTLGTPQSALTWFNQSFAIRKLSNQTQPTGSTLSRICYSHVLLGKPSDALPHCEAALELNEKAEDLRGSGSTLTFLGMAYAALNDNRKALDYFERALVKQREANDRRGEGVTLERMASIYAAGSEWQAATTHFGRALQLWRDIGDPDGEAITLYGWGKTEHARGNDEQAAKLITEALGIVESTRGRLRSKQLLGKYFAGKQNYYELKINIDMRRAAKTGNKEFVVTAFETREAANARNLLALLNEAKFLRSELLGNNDSELKELLRQQQSLSQKLNSKENERRNLLSEKHKDAARIALNKAIDELVAEYDRIDSKIRSLHPRIAALRDPQPSTVREIQQQLDPDTLLLSFSLGEKQSYGWVVTTETIRGFELAPREQIESVATRLLHAITARNRETSETDRRNTRLTNFDTQHAEAAAELSKLILEPVAPMLGQKRLVVVADGALQLIPFGFLPESGSPLITKHEIVSLPSASVLVLQRRGLANRTPAPLNVAVLADPVFEIKDQRVAEAIAGARKPPKKAPKQSGNITEPQNTAAVSKNQNSLVATALRSVGLDPNSALRRLMMSRIEATEILRVAPAQSLKALDFQANRTMAISGELSKYRYVHFATHGVIDMERPELSGIVLSMVDEKGKAQDGYLRLYEIYNINLPAELVVLSACQTGVGKQIRGEGLIALTRGFMYAGAARVVASLWKVDDSATAELMARFYKEIFTHGKRPAAALQAAQLHVSEQKRWREPYYWAGFVLQGEWR